MPKISRRKSVARKRKGMKRKYYKDSKHGEINEDSTGPGKLGNLTIDIESTHEAFLPVPDFFITSDIADKSTVSEYPGEVKDIDGDYANEFFVILDRAYQYNPKEDVCQFVSELQDKVLHKMNERYTKLKDNLKNLPNEWILLPNKTLIHLCKISENYNGTQTIFKHVIVNKNFTFSVKIHNMELPTSHNIYRQYSHVIQEPDQLHVLKLLRSIDDFQICCGNPEETFTGLFNEVKRIDVDNTYAFLETEFCSSYNCTVRSYKCELLTDGVKGRCSSCSLYRGALRSKLSRYNKENQNRTSSTSKTNYRWLSKQELGTRLKNRTSETKNLKYNISKLEDRLNEKLVIEGEQLDAETSIDMLNIMNSVNNNILDCFDKNSFQRLFWEQQLKATKCKDLRGVRWHPLIIKWCLHLRMKSNSAYESLRNSGFVVLPSQRTLVDYTYYVDSKSGFNPELLNILIEEGKFAEKKEHYQKMHALLLDEVKIKADLVYNKHSGELIGFTNLNEIGNQILNFERHLDEEESGANLATYMLVLMVRGLTTKLCFPFAHFPCNGITSDYLFPIVWEAIEYLEMSDINILCVICDGATPNRKFFRMHKGQQNDCPVYKTINPFAEEDRHLYFISDPPHLIKTARNCLANSEFHRKSRIMWKNGKTISWTHILQLYESEAMLNLRLVPKLTRAHVYLTSFTTMKVKLAAQVLSKTVSRALSFSGREQWTETASYCEMFDKFFDCLNAKELYEHTVKRNPNIAPYTSINDPRFSWLKNDFLGYFTMWKQEVDQRPGFSKSQKNKMFISNQTMEGLEITVHSFVECAKYLLDNGAPFVLSVKFNQDPLEQYFGKHRHCGGSNDNPTVNQFNYQASALRVQGSQALAPVRGNTSVHNRVLLVQDADNTPLPKKKRTR